MKAKSRSPREWAFWAETRLVNGYYPLDFLSKKAFFLYFSMLRRASLRHLGKEQEEDSGNKNGERVWLTSMGRNAFVTDTGLPPETYDLAVKELQEKGFVLSRPDVLPSPSYLKGVVYQIVSPPEYAVGQGFTPGNPTRDMAAAFEDFTGIDVDAGDRPVFFVPAEIIDKGVIKKVRSVRLLRLLLRLYSLHRLDTEMGIPQSIIGFHFSGFSHQAAKTVAMPNLNYMLDPAIESSPIGRVATLDRFITNVSDLLLEPMGLSRRELLLDLSELCGQGLLHFALVELTVDPEDAEINISTVINPIEIEGRMKKLSHKSSKVYYYSARPTARLGYCCQLSIKPNTVETERYLARIQQTLREGRIAETPAKV